MDHKCLYFALVESTTCQMLVDLEPNSHSCTNDCVSIFQKEPQVGGNL